MRLGIIGAMDEEIQLYKEALGHPAPVTRAGSAFYMGRWGQREVALCKSGVGKVNAAMTAQLLISEFAVTEVVFTGVAGALDPALDIGDIVISTDCQYHDVDASPIGFAPGMIPFEAESVFPADPGLVERAVKAAAAVHPGRTLQGRILSGDQFIGNPERARRLHQEFKGACVEMEGAAVAHVCRRNGIPFVIIRAISDRADGTAATDFLEFIRLAARRAFHIVSRMVAP